MKRRRGSNGKSPEPRGSAVPGAKPMMRRSSSSSSLNALYSKTKPSFHGELGSIMYGFGDRWNPIPETVDLMNTLVIEYMEDMTRKAMEVSRGKLDHHCLLFAIRNDQTKCDRVHQLIKMNKELIKTRKQRLNEEDKWFRGAKGRAKRSKNAE